MGAAVFDKDDDLAVEFVTAAANLRSIAYNIPTQSLFAAKVRKVAASWHQAIDVGTTHTAALNVSESRSVPVFTAELVVSYLPAVMLQASIKYFS